MSTNDIVALIVLGPIAVIAWGAAVGVAIQLIRLGWEKRLKP